MYYEPSTHERVNSTINLQRRKKEAVELAYKTLRLLLWKAGKKHGFEHSKDALYKRVGDLLVVIYLWMDCRLGQPPFSATIHIKSANADALWWDVFDLHKYKDRPLSSILWEANAAYSHCFCDLPFRLEDWSDAGIKALGIPMGLSIMEAAEQCIAPFEGSAEKLNEALIQTTTEAYVPGLRLAQLLAMMELGDYMQPARLALADSANTYPPPLFGVGIEKPRAVHIIEYCLAKMKADSAAYPDAQYLPELFTGWWDDPLAREWRLDPYKLLPDYFRWIRPDQPRA